MDQLTRDSTFFFWGKRDYVQGTHVTEEFLLSLGEWGYPRMDGITVTFLHPVRSQGRFILYNNMESLQAHRKNLLAILQGTAAGKPVFVGLRGEDKVVRRTVPDDEASLLKDVDVDTESTTIRLPYLGRDRLFTRLVAANKHLLKSLLPNSGYTPWVLGKLSLKLDAVHPEVREVSALLKNNLGNLMTRSGIYFDDSEVGEIQFTRRRS